jgi:hypothetical protein
MRPGAPPVHLSFSKPRAQYGSSNKESQMNRSIQSRIAIAALALGTLGAASAATAGTAVYLSVGAPAPVYVRPQPVYLPAPRVVPLRPQPVAVSDDDGDDGWRHEHERHWRRGCDATRWDPQARYMPGALVWRRGELYVASNLSASVWNVNSPPEWTPNYWLPARCR